MKINSKINKTILIIITTLIITYFSGTVWQVTESGSMFTYALIGITLLILGYFAISKRPVLYRKKEISNVFLYFVFLFFLTYITHVNVENYNYYIFSIFIILFSYLLVLLVNFNKFHNYFNIVLVLITIFSLINYAILNYTTLNVNFGNIVSNNEVTYYKGILSYFMISKDRNIGIFWEPGVFSSILLLGLVLQILNKNKNYFVSLVYIIGIVSTRSSAGLLLILPIGIIYLLEFEAKKTNKILFGIVFTTISFVLIAINIEDIINDTVILKLIEFDLNDTRIETIKFNFDLFKQKPIFGHGFTYINEITSQALSQTNSHNLMQTSTMSYYLSSAGIFGLGYTIIWISGIWKIKRLRKPSKILLIILVLAILNKEVHATILVTQVIMFYLLKGDLKDEISYEYQ